MMQINQKVRSDKASTTIDERFVDEVTLLADKRSYQ